MFPIVLGCLLLLVSCNRVPALLTGSDPIDSGTDLADTFGLALADGDQVSNIKLQDDPYFGEQDYSALNREKRTVRMVLGNAVLQGIKAVKRLLKGATEKTPKNGVKEYEKSGGFYRASVDFDRVRPKDVQPLMGPNGVLGKTGRVGDREMILRQNNGDRPTIEIKRVRDFKGQPVDKVTERITYNDNGYHKSF